MNEFKKKILTIQLICYDKIFVKIYVCKIYS